MKQVIRTMIVMMLIMMMDNGHIDEIKFYKRRYMEYMHTVCTVLYYCKCCKCRK